MGTVKGVSDQIGAWLADDLGLVRTAETLGYDTLWGSEGQGRTAFGKLERWAMVTEEVSLATGIVNVYSRSPATIAQAIATLDAHSRGRAVLGLGVAHPGVTEGFHGIDFDRPLARMAEYIELVRRYLSGVEEPFDGEFFSPGRASFWEAFDPRPDIPIYNAAIGPENVRLTGEYADGWLPNMFPIDMLEEALGWLAEGAERKGREISEIDVAMYIPTAVSADARAARQAVAQNVLRYWRDGIPGFYDRVAQTAGYEKEIRAVKRAPTESAAIEALSDELLDLVSIVGAPNEARARLASFRDAGIDQPIIRPVGDRSIVRQTLETFAPTHESGERIS